MTKLLMSRGRTLEELLANRGQAKAGAQLSARLVEIRSHCDQVIERLLIAESIAENLEAVGVAVPPLSKGIINDAKKSRREFRRVATALTDPDQSDQEYLQIMQSAAFNEALNFLEKLTRTVAGAFGTGLTEFKVAKAPKSLDQNVPDVPGEAAAVLRARAAHRRLGETVSIVGADLDMAGQARILENLEQISVDVELWERELPRLVALLEQQSPEFQGFLKAVALPEGASLDLLTEEVLQRLRESETLDQYRVRPR
jgi:DNA-binding protein YbaB